SVGEMDSSTRLARDRGPEVQPQGVASEVDGLAQGSQRTSLLPSVVATCERSHADLLGACVDGPPTWRAWRSSRTVIANGTRSESSEVFPLHRHEFVGTGNLEPVSVSLEPRSRLLARQVAVGLGRFSAPEL